MQMSTIEAPVAADIVAAYESQIEKMRQKDQTSKALSKEDLKVVHEDEQFLVVDKPAGVLCVPTPEVSASLSQSVFEAYGCESGVMDHMVVHRLGMDTSGLVVFARSKAAHKFISDAFRTRKAVRNYEALVCGHVADDEGVIDLPLMRDFLRPPFMRVSTDDLQRALIPLETEGAGEMPRSLCKKILERPKSSVTQYSVIGREELNGQPVTRLALRSVTGRTHQLNVHLAAIGHPIVGDTVYGVDGDALPNGGLDTVEGGASDEVQKALVGAKDCMCVHAKELGFAHPNTGEELTFSTPTPF